MRRGDPAWLPARRRPTRRRALDRPARLRPEPRPRGTGRPAARPPPRPPPCSVRPRRASRMGRVGPRARPARAPARRRRRLPTSVAEQLLDQLRQLARHPRARHDEVDAGRLPPLRGSRRRRASSSRAPGSRGRRAPPGSPTSRSATSRSASSSGASASDGERLDVVAGGAQHRLDLAAEQQVGDERRRSVPRARASGAGGTPRGRSPAGPTSARPRRGPRAPREAASRR